MSTRYIDSCPVGCNAALSTTEIVLPEGPLMLCGGCGQLLSQISEADYLQSMQAFNDAGFNLPDERAAQRRARVATRRLARIRATDLTVDGSPAAASNARANACSACSGLLIL